MFRIGARSLILTGIFVFVLCSKSIAASGSVGYDIIVIAGQSNAVGSGLGNSPETADERGLHKRIFQIGRLDSDSLQVVPAAGRGGASQLQFWGRKRARNEGRWKGFGSTFALLYAATELKAGRSVLIVPAAKGGTSIVEWLGSPRGASRNDQNTQLYPDMLKRIGKALGLDGDNRVVAFLWHQGEADINWELRNPAKMNPRLYGLKLQEFFGKVRKDIKGDYPIVAGKFVPDWQPGGPAVSGLKSKYEESIEHVAGLDQRAIVVDADNLISNYAAGVSPLPLQSIHFSAASQVLLGHRYFRAWKCVSGLKKGDIKVKMKRRECVGISARDQ